MPKVSPDHSLFAEPLDRISITSPVGMGIRFDKNTNSEGCIAVILIELHNFYGNRVPQVVSFEHAREVSAVYWVRHRLLVAVHDLGWFRDSLVTITQFTQPIQRSRSFRFSYRASF